MAIEEHFAQLKRGVDSWNQWRHNNSHKLPVLCSLNLEGMDLHGFHLTWANFTETDLREATLSKADLRNANCRNANLDKANLSMANVSEANFEGANFSGADLSKVNFNGANLSGANLSKTDLSGANLSGANLSKTDLSGANLSGLDLRGVNLRGANIDGISLRKANLHGANLKGLNLSKVDLTGTNFRGADLRETGIAQETGIASEWYLIWKIVNQRDISKDLSNADLREAVLYKVNLCETNLCGADLRSANLCGADLRAVNFSEADLRGANLRNTNLRKVIFYGANLDSVDLHGMELIEADLSFADLEGANLEGANLKKAYLNQAYLRRAYLNRANLLQARLCGAKLCEASLKHTNLVEANLGSAVRDLTDLSKADFSGANLKNANLAGCHALATDFTQAILTGACLEDWNINSFTKLDKVVCDYVYLVEDQQERRPSSGNFVSGEFTKLFQKVLETVDLIFANGIDWKAFFLTFQELQADYGNESLAIQAIEKKSGGAFVIRLEVAPETDKAALESQAKKFYSRELALLENKYRTELKAKNTEIAIYRQQSADLMEVVRLQATRPVNVEAKAVASSQSDSNTFNNDLREAKLGNFANQVKDNAHQQANQHNYSLVERQTLAEAAAEIKQLLKQLEQTDPTATETERIAYVNNETTLSFKRRVVGALKAGGEAAIEEFLDDPYVNVGKAIVKGWIKPE